MHSETLFEADAEETEHAAVERAAERAGIHGKYVDAAAAELISEKKQLAQAQAASKLRSKRTRTTAAWAASFVVLGLALGAWRSHSVLSGQLAAVELGRSQLDNVLQRRQDLVPSLIRVTKATLENQRALITTLEQANLRAGNATGGRTVAGNAVEEDVALQAAASEALAALARSDAANTPVVLRLSDEWAGSENRIARERQRFNEAATAYNRAARGFPTNLFRPLTPYPARIEPLQAAAAARVAPTF